MNHYDWRDLQLALAIKEHGSLSKVARELGLSPSTVSRRLDSLEEQIGIQLFERHATGYTPHPKGARLLNTLESIPRAVQDWDRHLAYQSNTPYTVITITAPSLIITQFPAILDLFKVTFPHLRLAILDDDRVTNLDEDLIDIAIRVMNQPDEHLWGHNLGEIDFVIAGANTYLEVLGQDDEPSWVVLDYNNPSTPVGQWERAFIPHTNYRTEVNSRLTQLSLIESGCGLGLVPRHVTERNDALGIYTEHTHLPPIKLWVLTHPSNKKRKEVTDTMSFLAKHGRLLLSDDIHAPL